MKRPLGVGKGFGQSLSALSLSLALANSVACQRAAPDASTAPPVPSPLAPVPPPSAAPIAEPAVDISDLYCSTDKLSITLPAHCSGAIRNPRPYTVAQAKRLFAARELAEVRSQLELDMKGVVVATNFADAPLCAWHLPYEAEPAGCASDAPKLWLADSAQAPRESGLELSGFASSFARLRAGFLWDSQLSPGQLQDGRMRYIDSGVHETVPFPLPVAGAHVRFRATLKKDEPSVGALPVFGSFDVRSPTDEILHELPAATQAPATLGELWPADDWIHEQLRRMPDCEGAQVTISPPLVGRWFDGARLAQYYSVLCAQPAASAPWPDPKHPPPKVDRSPTFYAMIDEQWRDLAAAPCTHDLRTDWVWKCDAERAVLSGHGKRPDVLVILHSGCSPATCTALFDLPPLSTEIGTEIADDLFPELDRVTTAHLKAGPNEVQFNAELHCPEEQQRLNPRCVVKKQYRFRYRGQAVVLERVR